jgi:hypothetical protein
MAAKSPYTANTWGQFKYCPYEAPYEEVTDCFVGTTAGGSKGGFFEYGRVKVKLSKPISLQGGGRGSGEEVTVVPATHGGETLEAPELPVTGGISLFNKKVQEEVGWPAALKQSWKEAKANGQKAVNVKIEMAGNECFEVPGCLDTEHILLRKGTAFRLPLKVKVTSPWLESLESGPCYIGSDENPIHVNLTTEGSGSTGSIGFNEDFTTVALVGSRLVDMAWHIEPASGPKGCGGVYESYIDQSLENVLEMDPTRTGVVILKGTLYDGQKELVETRGKESGEIP